MYVLIKLLLERSKKPGRDVAGEPVGDFGCEKSTFVADCAEEFHAVRTPPKREVNALTVRKPGSVPVATNGFRV